MEMGRINGGAAGYGQAPRDDSRAILDDCTNIDVGINRIDADLTTIQKLQQDSLRATNESETAAINHELDALSTRTMDSYRNLVQQLKKLKGKPGAGSEQNKAQVGRVDRRLKQAIQDYQTLDAEYRKKLQEQMTRQYLIVRPNASTQEVREAVEDTTSTQIFSQAVSPPSLSVGLSFI